MWRARTVAKRVCKFACEFAYEVGLVFVSENSGSASLTNFQREAISLRSKRERMTTLGWCSRKILVIEYLENSSTCPQTE